MLVDLVTKDGQTVWINPVHVKIVQSKTGVFGGKKGTEIIYHGTGGMAGGSIIVQGEPDEVAMRLNAAMPEWPYPPPDDATPSTKSSD